MGIRDNETKLLLGIFLIGGETLEGVNISNEFLKVFDLNSRDKISSLITSFVNKGYLQKLSDDEYKLTEKGIDILSTRFPFVRFLIKEWDQRWRIISYEIPEIKRHLRDRLRREMEGWGLGPWHRSFWITPHPIIENLRDLIVGKEEEQYVQAFTAEHSFGNKEILIKKVFKLKDLEELYKSLFQSWHKILSLGEDNLSKFKKIVGEYVQVLKKDPGLPRELIGSGWIGLEGWKIFNEIKLLLYQSNGSE